MPLTLLRSPAALTGGSARGAAVLVYAKDIYHVEALCSGAADSGSLASDKSAATQSAQSHHLGGPWPWTAANRSDVSGVRAAHEALALSAAAISPALPTALARRWLEEAHAGASDLEGQGSGDAHGDVTAAAAAAPPHARGGVDEDPSGSAGASGAHVTSSVGGFAGRMRAGIFGKLFGGGKATAAASAAAPVAASHTAESSAAAPSTPSASHHHHQHAHLVRDTVIMTLSKAEFVGGAAESGLGEEDAALDSDIGPSELDYDDDAALAAVAAAAAAAAQPIVSPSRRGTGPQRSRVARSRSVAQPRPSSSSTSSSTSHADHSVGHPRPSATSTSSSTSHGLAAQGEVPDAAANPDSSLLSGRPGLVDAAPPVRQDPSAPRSVADRQAYAGQSSQPLSPAQQRRPRSASTPELLPSTTNGISSLRWSPLPEPRLSPHTRLTSGGQRFPPRNIDGSSRVDAAGVKLPQDSDVGLARSDGVRVAVGRHPSVSGSADSPVSPTPMLYRAQSSLSRFRPRIDSDMSLAGSGAAAGASARRSGGSRGELMDTGVDDNDDDDRIVGMAADAMDDDTPTRTDGGRRSRSIDGIMTRSTPSPDAIGTQTSRRSLRNADGYRSSPVTTVAASGAASAGTTSSDARRDASARSDADSASAGEEDPTNMLDGNGDRSRAQNERTTVAVATTKAATTTVEAVHTNVPTADAHGIDKAAKFASTVDSVAADANAPHEQLRLRSVLLLRHMAWIYSQAHVDAALNAAADNYGELADSAPAVSVGSAAVADQALRGFIVESTAGSILSPLLRAVYCRQPEVVSAALSALTSVVRAGFFMHSTTPPRTGPALKDEAVSTNVIIVGKDIAGGSAYDMGALSVAQTHALEHAAAWALLDVVIACVCDGTYPMLDAVAVPLTGFLSAVMALAGAAPKTSTGGTDVSGSSASEPSPPGLHPSTLHRVVTTALALHTFAHQKRTYAGRGARWCERMGQARAAEAFAARVVESRGQAASILVWLRALIAGILASLERDAAAAVAARLDDVEGVIVDAHYSTPSRDRLGSDTDALRRQYGAPISRMHPSADLAEVSRVYAAHHLVSNVLAADVHVAVQGSVGATRRPPPLPTSFTFAWAPFPAETRSATADVAVLLAILSRLAYEPTTFSSEANAGGGGGTSADGASSGSSAVVASSGSSSSQSHSQQQPAGYRRLIGLLLRDTALVLLAEVFDAAGPAFAASPLLVGVAARLVAPSLWSHALTPRVTHTPLSICDDAADADAGNDSSDSGLVPPTSVLRATLHVVAAMWAARACEDGVSSGGGPAADSDAGGGSRNAAPRPPLNLREALAPSIGALVRSLLLPTLASRSAPPALRLDAVEVLSDMIAAPQALMELYLNHDLHPAPACPFPHMRLTRSIVATLVNLCIAKSSRLGGAAWQPGGSSGWWWPSLTAGGGAPALAPQPADPVAPNEGADGVVAHPDSLPATSSPGERSAAWDAWHKEELRLASASECSC